MNSETPEGARTSGNHEVSLFLLFNHGLTPVQEADAHLSLGVSRLVPLPANLKHLWAQIPPDLPALQDYLRPLAEWLLGQARTGDFVLVQGDFGACYLMAHLALEHGLNPVYATTQRVAAEEPQGDGSVRVTRRFEHRRFRRYGE